MGKLDGFFARVSHDVSEPSKRAPLLDWDAAIAASGPDDFGLFGTRLSTGTNNEERLVALNVTEPFCLLAVGVQGSGKSHTIGAVIENCVMRGPPDMGCLGSPMPVLVLHYDDSPEILCECATLVSPSKRMEDHAKEQLSKLSEEEYEAVMSKDSAEVPALSAAKRVVVIVSPSFYKQKQAVYESMPRTTIRPLLFTWDELSAAQIKVLMGIKDGDSQLYMKKLLSVLREYQTDDDMPPFEEFRADMKKAFTSSPGQLVPLEQRLDLLALFLAESRESTDRSLKAVSLEQIVKEEPGTVIIADLSDPLLDAGTANGIFQVLLEQFRDVPKETAASKLCVFDEAHKYMSGDKAQSGMLADTIVKTVRQMRHYGLRIAISTQSPTELPPEVVQLSSVVVCHRFHSREWFDFLKRNVHLPEDGFDTILNLKTGEALVFASKFGKAEDTQAEESLTLKVRVRERITADSGASVTHAATSRNHAA